MNYLHVIDGKITNFIVAEPDWVAEQPNANEFWPVDDAKGFININHELHDDGHFYAPQPHPSWIRDGAGYWRPPLEKPNPWQHMTISGHFGKTKDQIHTFKNVVDPAVAAAIVEFANSLEQWSEEIGTNANRLAPIDVEGYIRLNSPGDLSTPIYDAISGIIEDVALIVEDTFNVKVARPLPTIMRMGVGAGQGEHYDKMNHYYEYSETPVPDYDLTAVIYYNDDFTGGELNFPQHDYMITPETGMVVTYPGDMYHTHEVKEVKSGVRYTSPLFFSITELL